MSQENKKFGAFIKSTREKRGLTQDQLAAETSIPESQIRRIESGTNGEPLNGWHFIQLARALQVHERQVAVMAGYLPEPQPQTPLDPVYFSLLALEEFTTGEASDIMEYIEFRLEKAKKRNEKDIEWVRHLEQQNGGEN